MLCDYVIPMTSLLVVRNNNHGTHAANITVAFGSEICVRDAWLSYIDNISIIDYIGSIIDYIDNIIDYIDNIIDYIADIPDNIDSR